MIPGWRVGLSKQQEAFVEHYLTCWNAAQAARLAGYSEKTARQQGSRLLTIADIQAHVSARLDELKMRADEVLTRLTDIARGDLADFVHMDKHGYPELNLAYAEMKGKFRLVKKFKQTRRSIGEITESVTEIELYDAQAALNTLGKHHRLFAERLEVDWRMELEAAGLNPDDELEGLVNEFEGHLRRRAAANAGAGDQGSDPTS